MGKLIKKFFVQFFPWPLGGARPHLPLMTSRHCRFHTLYIGNHKQYSLKLTNSQSQLTAQLL